MAIFTKVSNFAKCRFCKIKRLLLSQKRQLEEQLDQMTSELDSLKQQEQKAQGKIIKPNF